MFLIRPSVHFMWKTPEPLEVIEMISRTCYKSEHKIERGSAQKFVAMLKKRGHEAMFEHASFSAKIICDRALSHQLVRHRLFSMAQESTIFCNYKNKMTFVIPYFCSIKEGEYNKSHEEKLNNITKLEKLWLHVMLLTEHNYILMMQENNSTLSARFILPQSAKTELVLTGNLRQWLNFFRTRCAKEASIPMRAMAYMLLTLIKQHIPIIFDDIQCENK
jgi:thymidylate synthase (FAD)